MRELKFPRLKWIHETRVMLGILIEILIELFENCSIYPLHPRSFGEEQQKKKKRNCLLFGVTRIF